MKRRDLLRALLALPLAPPAAAAAVGPRAARRIDPACIGVQIDEVYGPAPSSFGPATCVGRFRVRLVDAAPLRLGERVHLPVARFLGHDLTGRVRLIETSV